MTNNEAGAFLNITPDVLKKLDSFDEKLEKIEKHAHTAADALKNGFGSVVVDTSKLENAITSLAKKIDAIKGNPFEGAGKGAEETTRKTTSLNESLSRAADLLNRIGNNKIGEGSFANFNISGLKQGYSDLKKYVENMDLSKPQQKAAVEAMRYMKMELDEQRKTDEQRAQSKEKETERRIAADRRAAKAAEDARKAQEYAQRTTPQGALDYSRNTKSLQQNVQAIEYLKKARLSLNTTDANYKNTLEQINQAIARHNQALTEAGVKSQQLATRHRNLMDTAGQLSRQLALVFSVSQIEGYISKLAKVRGEFELQQRSLQAILQNKSQADQIFNKTVQLAVKSPFQIKELVTFTKQLAAYRIESNKLYDTTKRLADVSAGLGVDMGRLILAYGQVKAAAYLRGTEVRQFTEAGINMYGELQKLFKTRDQADYTTAQIVDMISKRKVTFEDVEQVFENLTSKEGIFYNMQEIQAETLQGKISNLKDSIDVMLNSIGKANEDTLKGSIDSVKLLLDNWEMVLEIAKAFGVVIGSMVLFPKIKAAANGVSLLSFAFTKAESSLRSLGLAFKSSLPLMALGAALQLVNELWNVHTKYNKMLRESSNKYYVAQLRIGEIDDIAKNDARKALSSLVKEMNNEGFEIEIKPNISEEEAKEQFEEYKKKYTDFLEDIRKIEANYAENRRKGWLIGDDDIETDLDEYENAFNDFIAKGNKIQAELLRISEESTRLGSGAKEYIQELVKGKKEGESLIDYYKRLADYLERIKDGVFFAGKQSSIASSFLGVRKDLEKEKEAAIKEIHEIFDTVNDEVIKGNKTREQLKFLIDKKALEEQWSEIKKELAYSTYSLGDIKIPLRPDASDGNPDPQSDSKHERDIWSERISVLKEMQSRYEKLNQLMGETRAIEETRSAFKGALDFTQMGEVINPEDIIPTKQGMIDALEKLLKQIPNDVKNAAKRTGIEKEIAELKIGIQQDYLKEQLEKTKKNIEDMFNQLDLHKKLKDAGLSEAEVQQLFPGLAKTLDDVEKEMKASYEKNFPKGEYLVADTDANKQYLTDLNKLNQQRIKDSQDLVIELTKAYKTQLSDQLQLDRWYYEERAKIANANLTEEQKTQYNSNLTSQYNKKSDENAWKQFQDSDIYISMFENIESSSTRMLEAMRDKLASLRENLKNLPADQLKAIINQQEKIDEMISQKNPFSGLTSGVKEYIQFLKQRKELEEENIRANNAVAYYTEQKNAQSQIVQQKKQEYDAAVEIYGVNSEQANQLRIQWLLEKSKLDAILAQLVAEGKITEETAEQIRNGQKLGKTLSDKFSEIGNNLSEFSSGITDVASNLENVFGTMSAGTADTISSIAEIAGGLGQTASGVGRIISGDVIGGGIQAIGGLAKTIGSLFNIKDKKKEREIQRQTKNIETLGKAYDELKEKMEAAWSADDLRTQTKDTVANLDSQIASYQAMIKAEEDKKKTDHARIEEWQDAIEELKKTKQEILNQEKIEMGGIGGESEYKDAASSFVQAWLDAFNETGDGLKGLEENFDDFINNLFLKQASMRIANKFLEPLFQMIDLAVTEGEEAIRKGFDGDTKVTRQEMDKIVEEAKKQFPQLSEALEDLYNALGIKDNKKAELSALQQGIQAMSEETAGELQALLNSIRFFVSQQTTDISAIRTLLDARYGLETEYSDSNPMLVELRTQTGYLEILSDRIDRVFAPSANSKGAGLRVYMQ
nr:MAG TPA: tail tape measure [Caudoviricetes sp.]